MKASEALRVVDDRLIEWLRKGDLTRDQQDRLIQAREGVVRIESLMIVARILDPAEIEDISRARQEALKKLSQG